MLYIDRTFTAAEPPEAGGEYEGCIFKGCRLPGADLSGTLFSDCTFRECDLSLARLSGTCLREVRFEGCKMLGLRFEHCNPTGFEISMTDSVADNCTFFRVKMPRAALRASRLRECDFTECDLSGAVIEGCDLTGALFQYTVLEKADLRGSGGYLIDPAANRVRRMRVSLSGAPGLLAALGVDVDPVG